MPLERVTSPSPWERFGQSNSQGTAGRGFPRALARLSSAAARRTAAPSGSSLALAAMAMFLLGVLRGAGWVGLREGGAGGCDGWSRAAAGTDAGSGGSSGGRGSPGGKRSPSPCETAGRETTSNCIDPTMASQCFLTNNTCLKGKVLLLEGFLARPASASGAARRLMRRTAGLWAGYRQRLCPFSIPRAIKGKNRDWSGVWWVFSLPWSLPFSTGLCAVPQLLL